MADFSRLLSLLSIYAARVDWFVYSRFENGAPEEVYKAAFHLYRAGGKRFRPFIVMATARMLGGPQSESDALPFAAAVELFHTYTLIHDDIMDDDDYRRGVTTTHRIWGVPYAILAGDLDYALSFKSILTAENDSESFDRNCILDAVETMVEASIRVAEGQGYDMLFEKRIDVDYHDYLSMIYRKTGALIEASAKLGAIAACQTDLKETMGEYGRLVGIAFQIRDDILGVFGDPSKTGKPIYNDLRRGKKTLLVLYAYKHATGEDKKIIEDILRGEARDEEILRRAAEIIRETGALEYAENLAKRMADTAVKILEDIGEDIIEDEDAKEALIELARFTVEREK